MCILVISFTNNYCISVMYIQNKEVKVRRIKKKFSVRLEFKHKRWLHHCRLN